VRSRFLAFRPEERVARHAVPVLPVAGFRDGILEGCAAGDRLVAFLGLPADAPEGAPRVLAVLADDSTGRLAAAAMEPGDAYPALTPDCPQAHLFERELAESWDVTPQGHPQPAPVRYPQRPFRPAPAAHDAAPPPGTGILYRVEGDAIHEVAVGPVHAGIIEPGHFRFQCQGETVLHLEIALGYQHRGVQRALVGGPTPRTPHLVETLAGDTSIGHALAHAQAVEALAGVRVPARAQAWRAIALELERLANHTGDLGALAQDVGYLPPSAYCGRIRGDFLNATAVICGNRFGRGWVRPGGVAWDADAARVADLRRRLVEAGRDARGAIELLWDTPSVLARFEDTGRLTADQAAALGLVGPAARACGLERDARTAFPSGYYRFAQIPVSTWATGDVFARAQVRWLEMQRSQIFLREQLDALPAGAVAAAPAPPAADSLAVSLVEGWRGEICHVAVTGPDARFLAYAVVDPSFHNWSGLALALRGQAISDFPLCNKSFNLSYCGFDL
jgi:Ni,Fe-hydrogenase III large subunit